MLPLLPRMNPIETADFDEKSKTMKKILLRDKQKKDLSSRDCFN